ncbi:MAG: hypothetical protein QM698_02860 [Micropepsaceae bacterium]
MRCGLRLAAFALALAGAAQAKDTAYDYARFVLPEGWVRNDEQRYGSWSPAGGGVTLSIFTRFGEEDAEDTLEDFIERSGKDETVIDAGKAEDISNDDFDVYRQERRVRDAAGRTVRRLYLTADKDDRATLIVIEGDDANFGRVEREARGIISSLTLMDASEPAPQMAEPDELPGEGGLDGFYIASGARGFLDVGTMRWAYGERPEALYFDPLGGVYRGAPARFDIDVIHSCAAATAWRCGRYRIEGSVLVLRWSDGSEERRTLSQEDETIRLNDRAFRRATGGGAALSGAFVFSDAFNAGDWPLRDAEREPIDYSIRFLEDGQFQIKGLSGFRNPRFAARVTASGRFKLDGHSLTLVYASGASEVLGFARFPSGEGSRLLVGGKVFAAP